MNTQKRQKQRKNEKSQKWTPVYPLQKPFLIFSISSSFPLTELRHRFSLTLYITSIFNFPLDDTRIFYWYCNNKDLSFIIISGLTTLTAQHSTTRHYSWNFFIGVFRENAILIFLPSSFMFATEVTSKYKIGSNRFQVERSGNIPTEWYNQPFLLYESCEEVKINE